jgi:transcriptional regulator with XRE-family HTH domain
MTIDPAKERATLAARLKEAREYVGLSQEDVAQILKIPRSAISLIEKGERKVDALELKQLAQIYQRNIDHFTGAAPEAELPEEIAHLARTASTLTTKDLNELKSFAQFLQSKSQSEKRQ